MNFVGALIANASNVLRLNLQMFNKGQKTEEPLEAQLDPQAFFQQQQLLSQLLFTQQLAQPVTPVQSKSKKISKRGNDCGHPDKEHYAKGMCSNCYHRFGRTKKPWVCGHDKLYAQGMCQNCYINKYNQKRRENDERESKE